ncbi:MAG: hypothetical protein J5594_06030 [Elusimicrobiaceae bacterium]|nr:hypothetical protein [Elusimicrobiaceae bacterium]
MFSPQINCQSTLLKTNIKQASKKFETYQKTLINDLATKIKRSLYFLLSTDVEKVNNKTLRSKPGEAPRMESGNLRSNIEVKIYTSGKSLGLEAGVFNGKAPYAKMLEYGTARIKPRPFLRPVLSMYKQVLQKNLPSTEDLFL